jgi:hypothetical protein
LKRLHIARWTTRVRLLHFAAAVGVGGWKCAFLALFVLNNATHSEIAATGALHCSIGTPMSMSRKSKTKKKKKKKKKKNSNEELGECVVDNLFPGNGNHDHD